MNVRICILFLAVTAAGGLCAQAAEPDRVIVLQDENFFLQDENNKFKASLAEKDEALRKLLLEKEALELKVDALQKSILARDAEFPKKLEQAALPYRVQMEDAVKELKVLSMSVQEKNARLADMGKEKEALSVQLDMLTGEKISLRASLRKLSDELDSVKAGMADKIAEEKASGEARQKDLQVRLNAEQTLIQEKIAQARKPLEDKVSLIEAQGAEKVRRLEEQVKALRESASRDIRQAQDACRQGTARK